MNTRTLATAFSAALAHTASRPPAPAADADTFLIEALRNSVTERDQIVLRRIGLLKPMNATSP